MIGSAATAVPPADLTAIADRLVGHCACIQRAATTTNGGADMRVHDLMSRNPVTITEWSSCRDAIERMHRARVRHLPVLDADGALVGLITDRDLRHHLFSSPVFPEVGKTSVDALLQIARVSDVMSSPAVTIDASDDVAEAARRMRQGKIGSLPVVEAGRLVGIVTEIDVLRKVCQADEARSPEVLDIVVSYP
jgi:acetoin utilization protein AcuB